MTKLGWTEKWTLRFAVLALLFLALSGFEGMLMRTQLYAPGALHGMEAALNAIRPGVTNPSTAEMYYSMLTAHPIIGGLLVSIGFLAFLINLVGMLGVRNVLSLFVPERWLEGGQPAPAQAEA